MVNAMMENLCNVNYHANQEAASYTSLNAN